jgi:hypothetical protein
MVGCELLAWEGWRKSDRRVQLAPDGVELGITGTLCRFDRGSEGRPGLVRVRGHGVKLGRLLLLER